MSKLLGPDFIVLQVKDLEESKKFYMQHLNLALAEKSPPGAVVFNTSPIPFGLRTAVIDLTASTQLGWGVGIWLACDRAETFCESMKQAGVKILVDIQNGPFGSFFTFKDPDGYAITLHTKTDYVS